MNEIEHVGTRKSICNTKKTLKAIEIDKERVENACNSGDDVGEGETLNPHPPPPNQTREESICKIATSIASPNSEGHTREKDQILTTILNVVEELRNNHGATDKIVNELHANN